MKSVQKILFALSLLLSFDGLSQKKPSVIKIAKPASDFMYHIDCYVDQDTLPDSFFKNIRSFALFNTNTDPARDFALTSWKLTVTDAAGKSTTFYSRKDNPNILSLDMIVAMQGTAGKRPQSIVFDSIGITETKTSGATKFLDGGKAVFFRGKYGKKCQ